MSSHFHTPSFGDEDFALDSTLDINSTANQNHWQNNTNIMGNESAYVGSDSGMISTDENEEKYGTAVQMNTSAPKLKAKKDPNEPRKPVPAYAAFFRDTQIAIKGQNPNAQFTEVSKIVASMWDALDPEHKNVYKKNAEIAKREYIKNLAEYKANYPNLMLSPTQTMAQHQTQQQAPLLISTNLKQIPFASKPAVFTISRVPQSHGNPGINVENTTIVTQRPNLSNSNEQLNSMQMMSPDQLIASNNREDSTEQPNVNMLAEAAGSVQKCIRDGCQNRAIVNPDWEDEYCSNECVIKHCQDVFTKWIQSNSHQQQSEGIST